MQSYIPKIEESFVLVPKEFGVKIGYFHFSNPMSLLPLFSIIETLENGLASRHTQVSNLIDDAVDSTIGRIWRDGDDKNRKFVVRHIGLLPQEALLEIYTKQLADDFDQENGFCEHF